MFKAERAVLWNEIHARGSEMDRLSSQWTIEQNKIDWKQAKPLLDELRNAQDKAEAIAHAIDEQPAAKIQNCLDRCAQESADRLCRHAR